jgi:hypothetical protein
VDPVPDPLLLRKFGSAGNRTRDLWICSQELQSLDHRGGQYCDYPILKEITQYSKKRNLWTGLSWLQMSYEHPRIPLGLGEVDFLLSFVHRLEHQVETVIT